MNHEALTWATKIDVVLVAPTLAPKFPSGNSLQMEVTWVPSRCQGRGSRRPLSCWEGKFWGEHLGHVHTNIHSYVSYVYIIHNYIYIYKSDIGYRSLGIFRYRLRSVLWMWWADPISRVWVLVGDGFGEGPDSRKVHLRTLGVAPGSCFIVTLVTQVVPSLEHWGWSGVFQPPVQQSACLSSLDPVWMRLPKHATPCLWL